ncbi:hypothetical protein LDENG_00206650 [Lucifuga dentata]|nr:hypothetical protein LDENG_00206650 [Lucifuga dentata]
MSKLERLNARVAKLLTVAVQEVLEVVKDTVSEYQEKAARTQRENESLKRRLQELQDKITREAASASQSATASLPEDKEDTEKHEQDLSLTEVFDTDMDMQTRKKWNTTIKEVRAVEMKLDEKIVTYFDSCNSPVDKEGFLYKKGEINTSYQKRWCVLKGNLLFYKERPADRELIGVIVLEGCTIQLCESEEQFAFSLVWNEPGLRTYKFAAKDQADQESWIKALLSANHGYLALLVMDLEKQYKEAVRTYSSNPANNFIMPNFNIAGYPVSTLNTKLPPYLVPGAQGGFSSGSKIQSPPILSKAAKSGSPKLWPKRNANVVPINDPASPIRDWLALESDTKEEFSKLHEDFGKEVKALIVDWNKRGRGGEVVQEKDLIDFG